MNNMDYTKIKTYFYLNKKSFILTSISGILYNGLLAFIPVLEGMAINALKEEKGFEVVLKYSIILFLFVLFIQLNRYFKRYYVRDFANKMTLEMRKISYQNLLLTPIEDLSSLSKGDIMNKQLSDIKDSSEGVRKALTEAFDTILLLLGYLISMMIMDPLITLLVIIFLSLSIFFASSMKKRIYHATKAYKEEVSSSKDLTISYLKNEVYYRGFGVSDNYKEDYHNKQNELEKKSVHSLIYKNAFTPLYQAVALVGLFFVLFLGGQKVIHFTWDIGTLTAYLTTYILVSTKASKTGQAFNAITTMQVSFKRCLPYLKNPPSLKELKEIDKSGLVVNHLSFGFTDDFVLKDISFTVPLGSSLGICGKVHTGKSTLGAALSGIYQYEGSISLNGVELKENILNSSDHFISYVSQEATIFNDTLKYNISFKEDSDVSRELEIVELNNHFKNQIDMLSHSLQNCSGGELKRIMIARSLYHHPSCLILDDPFSATDLNMSLRILDRIKEESKNASFILINNQKECLQKMDKILFLTGDKVYYDTYSNLIKNKEFNALLGGSDEDH